MNINLYDLVSNHHRDEPGLIWITQLRKIIKMILDHLIWILVIDISR